MALPSQPSLTERVRALYEDSVVPVREIAAIAGVTERTLYKYAAKGRWRRRVVRRADHAGPAASDWAARGAGGRFLPRAQAHLPHASGLKALDPAGAERAGAACERARVLSEAAVAGAAAAEQERAARRTAARAARSRERMLGLLIGAFVALARLSAEREARGGADARYRRLAGRLGHALIDRIDGLIEQDAARGTSVR